MAKRLLITAISAALFACALIAGCAQAPQSSDSSSQGDSSLEQIIVGSDIYPPYFYIDEDGSYTGIDVKILTEACRRAGYKPVFKTIDWEKKKDLLAKGEIDAVMGCFSMTGRESEYQWAGPYMRSRQVVAVAPSSDIKTLADLKGKVVAVQATTKPEGILLDRTTKNVPEVEKVLSFTDRAYITPALLKGYVDAIAAHETSIVQYEKDYNVELRIIDEPLQVVGLGTAFDVSDERGICEKVEAAFDEMRADGSMEQIISKYLDDAQKYLDLEGVDE